MITLDKAMERIQKALDGFATIRQMGNYAKEYANLIGKRTRLGKGVDANNAPQKSLKKLSDPYKLQRRKGKNPKLSSMTSPAKSNLTRTGELLSSLTGKGTATRKASIFPTGKRNEDITGWQEEQGRTYLRLSRPEINRLTRQIGDDLEQYIKKSLS